MIQGWHGKDPTFNSPLPGAVVSLDTKKYFNFSWVPGEAEAVNAVDAGQPGEEMTIIIQTVGTTSFVLTFTNNFKSTATLATGVTSARFFVLKFVSNGNFWAEISRTTAMV